MFAMNWKSLRAALGATVTGLLGLGELQAQSNFEPLPPVPLAAGSTPPAMTAPPVTITPVQATAPVTTAGTIASTPILQAVGTGATSGGVAPAAPGSAAGQTSFAPPTGQTPPTATPGLIPLSNAVPPTFAGTPAPAAPVPASSAPVPTPPIALQPLAPNQQPQPLSTPAPSPVVTPPMVPVASPTTSPAPVTAQPAAPATAPLGSSTSLYPATVMPANSSAPPMLVVKQVLPDQIAPGQPIIADVTVTNSGGRSADFVVITGWWTPGYDLTQESVASQLINGKRAWGMGAISAGESRTVRIKLSPVANAPLATEFRSGFDATFSSAVTDTRSVRVLKPELQLTVLAPESVFVGQAMTIHVKVKNSSPVNVSNVNFVVRLPDHLRHASGLANLEADVPSLAAGATETVPLEVIPNRSGDATARVRIKADNCDPLEKDLKISVIEPKMSVTLHGPKNLFQNWPATFEAVVENQGTTPIKMSMLEIKLPPGFRELRASDKPMYDPASHRLVWNLDTLQPGEKRTVVWFGLARQADDLTTTGTISVGNMPIKRSDWTTKNAGQEAK